MVVIAAAVVVAFVSALYFITHRKVEEIDVIPGHKVTGNGLPPKPEERWRYIKELENRQTGVRTPTEPTAGGEVLNSRQLTNEQRQLLYAPFTGSVTRSNRQQRIPSAGLCSG